VLLRGEYVACVLVKLIRKLGWNVGHAESCARTIAINPEMADYSM